MEDDRIADSVEFMEDTRGERTAIQRRRERGRHKGAKEVVSGGCSGSEEIGAEEKNKFVRSRWLG